VAHLEKEKKKYPGARIVLWASLECTNFSNAEFFDCNFLRCNFDNSTFVSVGIWNTVFNECTFANIDFESAYIENAILVNPKFINPVNLDNATRIIINVGTITKPVLLSHEESVKWIQEHTI
jgi:uncharacterized protein YjbI with pentapeptide repeats